LLKQEAVKIINPPMSKTTTAEISEVEENLVAQVHSFIAERELLNRQLGVSDASDVIALVNGLEQHAKEFYTLKEEIADQTQSLRNQITVLERFA